MSALMRGLNIVGEVPVPIDSPRASHVHFVLPRWLRRPARYMRRLSSGEVEPPRFAATMASAILLAGFGLAGVIVGGHAEAMTQAVSARTGFAVEEIRVTGNRETSEIDIFDRIGLDGWTALVGLDVGEARRRIAGLPWIEDVAVRKVYPTTLQVDVVERKPFAIWQHAGQLSVIDHEGQVIAPLAGRRHANLPLVVGNGAATSAAAFIEAVSAYPTLARRVVGYIRVSDRRWDLRLANGITLRLPEEGALRALGKILELDRETSILTREVETIDLRFEDRLVVRLTAEGLEHRESLLRQRLGRNYRSERRT